MVSLRLPAFRTGSAILDKVPSGPCPLPGTCQFLTQWQLIVLIFCDKTISRDENLPHLLSSSFAALQRQEGEEKPIGLILCAETSREQVELLEMNKDGIMVAEYWTELPPKKALEEHLHKALIEAREMLERKKLM